MSSRLGRMRLVATALGLVAGLVLAELACQVYALVVFRQWDALMQDPRFYYARSDDPVLVYEPARDRDVVDGENRMHLNRDGIREDGDRPFPQELGVGVVGDSVTFGVGEGVRRTFPEYLQRSLDPATRRVKVFNFGVPGYALPEIARRTQQMNALYSPRVIVYLMNMNDFAMRDTVYEGADNGLYRMYRRPGWKLLWFVRKAMYRAHKGEQNTGTDEWVRWLYRGGRDHGLPYLDAMKRETDARGQRFVVVLLPVGTAYRGGIYTLEREQDEVDAYLASRRIEHYDWRDRFRQDTARYVDPTDHLTEEGYAVLSGLLCDAVSKEPPLAAVVTGCSAAAGP